MSPPSDEELTNEELRKVARTDLEAAWVAKAFLKARGVPIHKEDEGSEQKDG